MEVTEKKTKEKSQWGLDHGWEGNDKEMTTGK